MKVRAWDEDNKKMIYSDEMQGYRIDIDKNGELIMYREETNYDFSQLKFNFIPLPMMVSTGYKDKTGKEIYEGDIVEYIDGEYSFVGIVKNSIFGLYATDNNDNYKFEDFADENTMIAEVKVIGNIHENMELLEVK